MVRCLHNLVFVYHLLKSAWDLVCPDKFLMCGKFWEILVVLGDWKLKSTNFSLKSQPGIGLLPFIRCFNNNFKHYRSEFTRYTKCALTNKTKQTSSQLCLCDDLIISISILFIFLCQFAVSLIFVITTIIFTIASPTRTDVFIIRIFTVKVLAIVPREKKKSKLSLIRMSLVNSNHFHRTNCERNSEFSRFHL